MVAEMTTFKDSVIQELASEFSSETTNSELKLTEELNADLDDRVSKMRASWRAQYRTVEQLAREEFAEVLRVFLNCDSSRDEVACGSSSVDSGPE